MPSYGAEMRGGTANCSVIVSDTMIGSPIVGETEILIAMNKPSVEKFQKSVVKGGTIIIDSSIVDPSEVTVTGVNLICVPATQIATEMGAPKIANMVMCGALIGVNSNLLTIEVAEELMAEKFTGKKAVLIPTNKQGMLKGKEIAETSAKSL